MSSKLFLLVTLLSFNVFGQENNLTDVSALALTAEETAVLNRAFSGRPSGCATPEEQGPGLAQEEIVVEGRRERSPFREPLLDQLASAPSDGCGLGKVRGVGGGLRCRNGDTTIGAGTNGSRVGISLTVGGRRGPRASDER